MEEVATSWNTAPQLHAEVAPGHELLGVTLFAEARNVSFQKQRALRTEVL